MSEKIARAMTAKTFIRKSSGSVSAEAFIQAQREWLETGELAQFTSPLLARLDAKDILPTPCLEALRGVVLGYKLAQDTRINEVSADKNGRKPKKEYPFVATIYNADGVIQTRMTEEGFEKDLIQGFESPSLANNWVDNRLFSGVTPDCYGVIVHTKMIDKNTEAPMQTIINREDSIARVMKTKRNPVMAKKPQQSSLGWGAKVKNSTCHFSHG